MKARCLFAALGLVALSAHAEFDRKIYQRIWPSVARVAALNTDNTVAKGSAVVVAPGKLITNCHVTRDARAVDIIAWGSQWKVKQQVKDIGHDLCLLIVGTDLGKVVELADPSDLKIGRDVAAVGYPSGLRLQITEGHVKGLHLLDGERVIQSSAPFASGESGGGLFDRDGKLVGIITFRAAEMGDYYFALPAAWIKKLLDSEVVEFVGAKQSVAFWEQRAGEQPNFLRAISHETQKDWPRLKGLADEWIKLEAQNPEAYLALGKSSYFLHQPSDAVEALRKAVALDPQHSLAWLWLGLSYRDSRDTQGAAQAMEQLFKLDPAAAKMLSGDVPRDGPK